MHKIIEELNICQDCGGVNICYHFLKKHYCPGGCGKTQEQLLLEAKARGEMGLLIKSITPEQEDAQWNFGDEATEEDWDWVDVFNGRPAGYTTRRVGWSAPIPEPPTPKFEVTSPKSFPSSVGSVERVEAAPLDVDWTSPGNAVLWAWIVMKGLDKPLPDSRSVYRFRNGPVEVVYPWRVLFTRGFNCGICGDLISLDSPRTDPLGLVFDHIVPVSKGGVHSYSNIQPAHNSCNTQKAAMVDGWQDIKPMVKAEVPV